MLPRHSRTPGRPRRTALVVLVLATVAALQGLVGAGSAQAIDPPPIFATLAVEKTGTGAGYGLVTGGGVNCGATCVAAHTIGSTVILSAPGTQLAVYQGWSGCDSVSQWNCTVTLQGSRTVSVAFALRRTLSISFAGSGSGKIEVAAPGTATCLSSDSSCVYKPADGATVVLDAEADAGSTFAGWGGPCNGTQSSCSFVLSADTAVSASFELPVPPTPLPPDPPPGDPVPIPGPPAPEPPPGSPTPAPAPAPAPAPSPAPAEPGPVTEDTCTITGTPANDVLVGTRGRDVICGLGGSDRLIGKGGNDVLIGGAGADVLNGGAGRDRLEGGRGLDLLLARDRTKDRVDGGIGRDRARIDLRKDLTRRIEATF
jgi:RTX calcium-binding nonapeptide repeat (4 copies)/Divergent InlB B-repeat domain